MISLLLFAVAPVASAAPVVQDPPVIVEGERPKEKAVCRTERETGSRMVKKICRTPTEQRQVNTNARNALRLGNRSAEPEAAFPPPKGE